MDLSVDWGNLLTFSIPPLETVLRGTLMYWFLFLMFRFVARRDVGSLGIADLLIVVIVADAAQNGMAGKGDSVVDTALLVATLIAWNRLFDLAAWWSPTLRRFVDPPKVVLVRRGKKWSGTWNATPLPTRNWPPSCASTALHPTARCGRCTWSPTARSA